MARIAGNENSLGSVIGALSSPFVRRTATIYYAQAIAIFYCCALLVLLGNARLKARLQPLAKLGRMALTNYLMHCAIAAVIFFGFGAYGKVGPATAILLALVVYAIQIPLSAWWLNRYRFGPVEWIWRSLTYGRVQPMKAA
jgi:uncharacterized protein